MLMGHRTQVTKQTRDYIRSRDGGICVYCSDAVGQEIDHVLPVKHGGKNIRGNLVLACESCNGQKKGRLDEVLMARAFRHLLAVGESLEWVDRITMILDEWG
jgi:5-methylcytosine-specific restriction endonuclease McrA